jgi:hypothetical protein
MTPEGPRVERSTGALVMFAVSFLRLSLSLHPLAQNELQSP